MSKITRHIKVDERVAAALSQLLPDDVRADMRKRKAPAREVISLFELDHNVYFAWAEGDEVNEWHNLTWLEKGVHREKTRIDQGKIAKVRRHAKKEAALKVAQENINRILAGERQLHKAPRPPRFKKKMNGKVIDMSTGKEI
jgi:hypothetical protein